MYNVPVVDSMLNSVRKKNFFCRFSLCSLRFIISSAMYFFFPISYDNSIDFTFFVLFVLGIFGLICLTLSQGFYCNYNIYRSIYDFYFDIITPLTLLTFGVKFLDYYEFLPTVIFSNETLEENFVFFIKNSKAISHVYFGFIIFGFMVNKIENMDFQHIKEKLYAKITLCKRKILRV